MSTDDTKPAIGANAPSSPYTPPSDPNPYIRTFAKDVAAVTNTPLARVPHPEPVFKKPAVELPIVDSSPVNNSRSAEEEILVPEIQQESVVLSKDDSSGIFATPSTVSEIPVVSPILPLPTVAPVDEEREAVLARLRAKVAAYKVAPPPPPPPPPEIIAVAEPSPIHTFSSDFADRIDGKKASTFSVLAAQSDAGQSIPAAAPSRSFVAPFLIGIALLLVSGAGVFMAYRYLTTQTAVIPVIAGTPSLIPFDSSTQVTGSQQELFSSVNAVSQQATNPGTIIVTYIQTKPDASGLGGGKPAPGGELVQALSLPAPSILLRNIDPSSTVGVVNGGTTAYPFMILKANSYERTFSGMLAWEPTMFESLRTWYPLIASDTATQPSPFFVDIIVANHDVRALRDSSGKTLVVYGYFGKEYLIIARDESAFSTIIARLRSVTP